MGSYSLIVGVLKYFLILGLLSTLRFILCYFCPMALLSNVAFLCPPTWSHDENVLWSVALPQVLYVTSILYTPKWVTAEIDKILFKFLWSDKKPHVKKETIIADIDYGGLKMVHFESVQKAIKLSWIKRLNTMSSNCAALADAQTNLPIPITDVFQCKFRAEFIHCKSLFYQQLLEYWFDLYSIQPETFKDIFVEPLWFNVNIMVGGSPIFYRQWWKNDIRWICDICNSNGTIMTKEDLQNKFNFVVGQMEYNSLVSAIPDGWRQTIKNQSVPLKDNEIYIHLKGVRKNLNEAKCRDFYKSLISRIKKLPTAIQKWKEVYDIKEDEWGNIFRLPYRICSETDLQAFQYKIINRFFPCNYTLSIWYSDITNICQYCHQQSDTLVHYFVYCTDVAIFWKQFGKMWKRIFEFWFPLSELDILFGLQNETCDEIIDTLNYWIITIIIITIIIIITLNYCVLFAKFYIYGTKKSESKVFFFEFVHILKNKIKALKTIYVSEKKYEQFVLKWSELYDNL